MISYNHEENKTVEAIGMTFDQFSTIHHKCCEIVMDEPKISNMVERAEQEAKTNEVFARALVFMAMKNLYDDLLSSLQTVSDAIECAKGGVQ